MKEKTKLPKNLKVGGFNYEVVYPYNFDDKIMGSDNLGLFEPATLKIKVSGVDSGGIETPNSVVMYSFLHEIFHAIDRVYCSDNLDNMDQEIENKTDNSEITIPTLANGWYQVLKDNKIFSIQSIPKKIKIFGYDYIINFPYDLEGEDHINISGIEYHKMMIKIRDIHTHGIKYDFQNIRHLLLSYITHAIVYYSIRYAPFTDDLVNSFAFGLYQVLVDNNIEQLIHKYK